MTEKVQTQLKWSIVPSTCRITLPPMFCRFYALCLNWYPDYSHPDNCLLGQLPPRTITT